MRQNATSETDKKNWVISFRIILMISVIVTSILPIYAERIKPYMVYKNVIYSGYFAGGRDILEINKNMRLLLSLPAGWKDIYVPDTVGRRANWKEEFIVYYPCFMDSMQVQATNHERSPFFIRITECNDERYLREYSPRIDSLISYTYIMGKYIDFQGLQINKFTGEKRYYRGIALPEYKVFLHYQNIREEELDLFNKIFDNIIVCDEKSIPMVTRSRKRSKLDKLYEVLLGL